MQRIQIYDTFRLTMPTSSLSLIFASWYASGKVTGDKFMKSSAQETNKAIKDSNPDNEWENNYEKNQLNKR